MLVQSVVNEVVEIEQVLDGNVLVGGGCWSRGQICDAEELAVTYAVANRIGFVIGIPIQAWALLPEMFTLPCGPPKSHPDGDSRLPIPGPSTMVCGVAVGLSGKMLYLSLF